MTVLALVAVFIVAVLASLYAYRSQTPAIPTVSMSQALDDIGNARVDEIVVQDNSVTITLTDGRRERVDTGGVAEPILTAASDLNRRLPGRSILVRYEYSPMYRMSLLDIAFRFLPLIALIALVSFVARGIARTRRADRYERLARIADLRDRGVLSEDEFQAEKRKVMR